MNPQQCNRVVASIANTQVPNPPAPPAPPALLSLPAFPALAERPTEPGPSALPVAALPVAALPVAALPVAASPSLPAPTEKAYVRIANWAKECDDDPEE
jgi:hypothetical protein